jgi:DNA-directed RNA polymerase beta subunit
MYLDMHEKWDVIKRHVTDGIRSLFPIEVPKGRVELISVEMKEPENLVSSQREALIKGGSLTASVYGTFRLTDGHGGTVDTAKIKILDLPLITHRGTFVVQGKDYSVFNQMRLRPGVYTTKSEESGDVTSRFNLGKGLGFKIELSPNEGIFYVRFDKSKASTSSPKIPLYSLVRVLGAADSDIKARWGERIYNANHDKSHIIEDARKIVDLTVYGAKRTGNDVEDIRNYFNDTQLNGDTTKVTLGSSYDRVQAGALLDATAKMVHVYSGAEHEDDMDSLLFKEILSVEDHLMLRIQKGIKDTGVLTKIKRKIGEEKELRKIIPTNMLTKLIETFYTTSSLASPQTEINPIEILETNHKITAMGEGGIKSEHGIPMSARNLHPSHFGFLDPVRTTESTRVGVDLRTTHNSEVKNRNIYTTFIDRKGAKVSLRPIDLSGKTIGFPGQEGHKIVRVLLNGEMKEVPAASVDYWMEKSKDMFTYTSNLVPFLHNDQGNRVTMASRMVTQAVPLVHREAPLVQVEDESEHGTFQKRLGTEFFSPKAPEDGTVNEIGEGFIRINNRKVDLYHNFPLNEKTYIHMTPLFKVGDKVKKGQIVAESNFTKDGTLAIGTNLRTAYIGYKGWNHEDGMVISQHAATKLTSQHMYVKEVEKSDDVTVDKNRLIKFFPSKITAEQMRKLDDEGVAQKGQTIHKGDYVIAALAKRDLTNSDMMLSKLRGALANPYKDVSEVWDHDRPGTVTDVIRNGNLVRVILTTEDETRVGDKLTGVHGNKGTVTLILPNHEMPKDKDGKHIDMLWNTAGVISRVNPGQLYEAMAGKIAAKTGSPYIVKNFSPEDSSRKVINELKAHGLKPEEDLYDAKTGRHLGEVFVGNPHVLKLHKQTEGNFAARFTKNYDVNLQPAKGGEEGSKAIGLQDVYALLGHNARANLHEMGAYKSQRNEEFWDSVRIGLPIPPAKEPFAFEKFKSLIGAAGIHVNKGKDAYTIAPMSDKHIVHQSAGEIKSSALLASSMNSVKVEPGGLFDESVTGGLKGKNWAHMELSEHIINPLFGNVVKTMLGGTDPYEMKPSDVKAQLAKIDVDKRIAEIRSALGSTKGSPRDKLLKELRYLMAAKKLGMHPKDYVLSKFPILPPQFRPVYPSQSGGVPMVSDINYLYRDMMNVNNELSKLKDFPETDPTKLKLRKDLQQAAGAIVGVMKPVNKKSEKQDLQGVVPLLTGGKLDGGGTSKESFFHRKLMKRNQDLTGRGTILPDPSLHVDYAKIPIDMAHQLFKPFVINNLVKKGLTPIQAAKDVADRTHIASRALEEEMERRPILLNRAPTLHKYNMMAFKPVAVEGKSIFIPPLIIKGFNADFDGDSVAGDTYVIVQDTDGTVRLVKIKDVE